MKLIAVCLFVVCFANLSGVAGQTTRKPTTSRTTVRASATKQSTVTTKNPIITTKKPIITTKKPIITTKNPIITTKKPIVTTEKPVVSASLKICRDTNSTATSGSIQSLDGLTPMTEGPPRTCNFSIVVPTDQRVQLSCSVANLSTFNFTSTKFDASQGTTLYSLTFDDTVDIFMSWDPILPSRVYYSRSNTILMTYRVINASDSFDCSWKTFKAPTTTTTDLKWCRDEQTSMTSGTIQTLDGAESSSTAFRMCPFFINTSPNRQVQMSCSGTNVTTSNGLMTFEGAASWSGLVWRPEVERETASGNRIDLFTIYFRDDQLNCKWITANASDTTKPSDFNFCFQGQSTASTGTIQPMANLTLGPEETKWCLYSVIAPADKRIQVSCSVVNLTNNEGVYNYLMFGGVTDLPFNGDGMLRPTLNRVYTSIKNRIDVSAFYVKGDKFNCNWNIASIPVTTTFTFCIRGETTVEGTIQSSANLVTAGESRMCRFAIMAPQNKRVQFVCSTTDSLVNSLMEYDDFGNSQILVSGMVVNKVYTSYGNELLLYASVSKTQQLNCKWVFI